MWCRTAAGGREYVEKASSKAHLSVPGSASHWYACHAEVIVMESEGSARREWLVVLARRDHDVGQVQAWS